MRSLGAVSAAMLDKAERIALERQRVEQIRIEKQWASPRRRSVLCKKGAHSACFAVNCSCRCEHGVKGVPERPGGV